MPVHQIKRGLCAIAVIAALRGIAVALGTAPAAAQTAPGAISEAQELNGYPGVVAEMVLCKRDAGVLSIRMRLRNTGGEDAGVKLVRLGNYDQFYFTAAAKKYFVLRDTDKTPLATPINAADSTVVATVPKGGSYVWYAKYPAPPADSKKINYYTPLTPPFEDIPITD